MAGDPKGDSRVQERTTLVGFAGAGGRLFRALQRAMSGFWPIRGLEPSK